MVQFQLSVPWLVRHLVVAVESRDSERKLEAFEFVSFEYVSVYEVLGL